MYLAYVHVANHLASVGLFFELAFAFGAGIFIGRWSKR